MQFPKQPAAFILLSTGHGVLIINRFDCAESDGVKYGVGHDLLSDQCFSGDALDVIVKVLESRRGSHGDGVVVLDCGANIGVHAVHLSKCIYGWGEVIAFEAQERVFYALAGNIAANNCFNARAVWAALGAEVGVINVPEPNYFIPSNFGGLELRKSGATENIGQNIDYDDGRCRAVDMISVDSLGMNRVDFIKIDVEGMEMEVLAGAKQTIASNRPTMLIEIIKSGASEINTFLKDRGYAVYDLGDDILAVHGSDPAIDLIPTARILGHTP